LGHRSSGRRAAGISASPRLPPRGVQCYVVHPMALTTWSFPTSIVFGPGALSALPARVQLLNAKRPLLVCDAGVAKAGLAAKVQKVLESAGLPVAVFDKVDPNPVEQNVIDGLAAYQAHGADLIVSLGGGSPLDTGKLIALRVHHDRPLHEYDD